ncbi:putative small s protein [Rosellinia necatrix]|uniref:Putative small s protein n=1 Tax=Rosellinia necatrix TaxID=77044 RepID=A0A1S8A5B3_ROSNE|nr:putative small s protein [Rosellinia necatrix]
MSDPFSITAGAISVATAFSACIEGFKYVQLGRHFGRDYQTFTIRLAYERERLARWGEAVHVDTDPRLSRPDATAKETQIATETLVQITMLFTDTEKISKMHGAKTRARADLPALATDELGPAVATLRNRMREPSVKRQRSSLLKLITWAIYHKSEYQELIANIAALIDNLEKLFPAPQPPLKSDRGETAENCSAKPPKVLEDAPRNVDGAARAAVLETGVDHRHTGRGHQYTNIAINGEAHIGDIFSDGWRGAYGASHRYNGLLVGTNAKVLVGNKFGGKDFWDD